MDIRERFPVELHWGPNSELGIFDLGDFRWLDVSTFTYMCSHYGIECEFTLRSSLGGGSCLELEYEVIHTQDERLDAVLKTCTVELE